METNTNTFYKTFTGTDSLAFAIFPNSKPILLGSLTTLSYSIYREKKPVPLIGKINGGGYTRGMRSVAGTMIFTLINQHFTKEVVAQLPYLKEHGKLKADELPFFDIMVVSANEYGASTQMMIYGIDIIEEGQVLSIQDIYIENTFSFIARDIDEFTSEDQTKKSNSPGKAKSLKADTVTAYDFSIDGYNQSYSLLENKSNEDLMAIQATLMEEGYLQKVSGIMDNETVDAIKDFQRNKGMKSTGIIDDTIAQMLTGEKYDVLFSIENKNGAFIYSNTSKDKILGISKYKDELCGERNGQFIKVKVYGIIGYIEVENTSIASKPIYFYEYKKEPGVEYRVTLEEFDGAEYGAIVTSDTESEVKITAISYFEDDTVEVNERFYEIKPYQERTLYLSFLSESYIYNLERNLSPYKVEFIILPTGSSEPKKWTIRFRK